MPLLQPVAEMLGEAEALWLPVAQRDAVRLAVVQALIEELPVAHSEAEWDALRVPVAHVVEVVLGVSEAVLDGDTLCVALLHLLEEVVGEEVGHWLWLSVPLPVRVPLLQKLELCVLEVDTLSVGLLVVLRVALEQSEGEAVCEWLREVESEKLPVEHCDTDTVPQLEAEVVGDCVWLSVVLAQKEEECETLVERDIETVGQEEGVVVAQLEGDRVPVMVPLAQLLLLFVRVEEALRDWLSVPLTVPLPHCVAL